MYGMAANYQLSTVNCQTTCVTWRKEKCQAIDGCNYHCVALIVEHQRNQVHDKSDFVENIEYGMDYIARICTNGMKKVWTHERYEYMQYKQDPHTSLAWNMMTQIW